MVEQPKPTGTSQFIEQKISVRVTITAGSTGSAKITIPANTKAFLKGYGYTWFADQTYKLRAGTFVMPSRTDQEGSTSIPVIYGNPFRTNSGEDIELTIINGSGSSHTYDVVFYIISDRIVEIDSVGGELVLATGGSGSTVGGIVIYDSTFATSVNVTAKGLEVEQQSPATLLAGTKTTSGASAEALGSSTACKKITIQVASGSPDVDIGNATSQTIRLVATQSIEIAIDNLSKIYIKRVTTDPTVNYIGG